MKLKAQYLITAILSVVVKAESNDRPVYSCPFTLPSTNKCVPTSVTRSEPLDARRMRPSDVQFIMAAGDSITAGLFSTWYAQEGVSK